MFPRVAVWKHSLKHTLINDCRYTKNFGDEENVLRLWWWNHIGVKLLRFYQSQCTIEQDAHFLMWCSMSTQVYSRANGKPWIFQSLFSIRSVHRFWEVPSASWTRSQNDCNLIKSLKSASWISLKWYYDENCISRFFLGPTLVLHYSHIYLPSCNFTITHHHSFITCMYQFLLKPF